MDAKRLKTLIAQGEKIDIEFKEAKNALNKNVFETVCAFLNRHGGHLILGIRDDGEIIGVSEEKIEKIINDFITISNNPQKLNPTFYFSPEIINIDGKKVVYIFVPESSQVHKTAGKIFDRNNDGDFEITNNTELVTALYFRKQTTYSENMIFPYATIDDLRRDLIDRVRLMAKSEAGGNHPWGTMTDEDLLNSARLYQKDLRTGKEGYTLAAILLFGKDETILSALPHHRTDAILRRKNLDRYDDRDDIRTNLIESYDRLLAFVKKHLPDPFYLEDDRRVSLRNKIFREAIVNILIHREFINPFPAKMIIGPDEVLFENASRPHGYGRITPDSFSPFPKNPNIARVFKEIGLADELGSGVRNLFKYTKIYSGTDPEIIEGDIFKIIIPTPQVSDQVGDQVSDQVSDQVERFKQVIEFCREPKTREEIMNFLNLHHRAYFRAKILNPLIEQGYLKMTMPEKPNSPKQKYYAILKRKLGR